MAADHLLPSNATAEERALSLVTQLPADIVPENIRNLWRPDAAPIAFLPYLAWGMHVDLWKEGLPETLKRALIARSAEWHRVKGTRAGILRLLEVLGYPNVELVEYCQVQEQYYAAGIRTLDGTWRVGSEPPEMIRSVGDLAGGPDLRHWAQFIILCDLADAARANWVNEIRWAVDEMKPLRAWPLWAYRLLLTLAVIVSAQHSLAIDKTLLQRYPWANLILDGTWRLGRDATVPQLTGRMLDGAWRIGEAIAGCAARPLKNGKILSSALLRMHLERPERHNLFQLSGEVGTTLRLNSGWRLGRHGVFALVDAVMTKHIDQDAAPDWALRESWKWELGYPFNPSRLASPRSLRQGARLGRGWKLNAPARRRPLDGSWRVRAQNGIATEPAGRLLAKSAEGAVRSAPLGKTECQRRLCGSWKLREGVALGRAPLLTIGPGWAVGQVMWPLDTSALVRKHVDVSAYIETESTAIEVWELQCPATRRPLAGRRRLDGAHLGGWKVGEGRGSPRTLGGQWRVALDVLGCETTASECMAFEMPLGKKPLRWRGYRLGASWKQRLDGGWHVGAARSINGGWRVEDQSPVALAAPKVGPRYRRVDGSWIIGARARKLNGAWRVGYAGAETSAEIVIRKRG